MSSKWLPWDFLSTHRDFIYQDRPGVYAYHVFDPIVEKVLFNRVHDRALKGQKFNVKLGSEVSVDWLETELFTLSLFQDRFPILILHCEKLSPAVIKFLSERKRWDNDRFIFFSFTKITKFFSSWPGLKQENSYFYEVTPPRFWESLQFVDFLASELNLNLDLKIKTFLSDNLGNNVSELYSTLNMISLKHATIGKYLTFEEVKEIVQKTNYDQFKLASMFSQKRMKDFFTELLEWQNDTEALRSFCYFMQGHIFKILDPSFIEKKSRQSKYDKEILNASKVWKSGELLKGMQFFCDLETKIKLNDLFVEELRLKYFKVFS